MAAAMVPLEVALSGAIGARYVYFVLFASGLLLQGVQLMRITLTTSLAP